MGIDTAQPNADLQPGQDANREAGEVSQNAGMTMTQAQIDAIVQGRLAEERRRLQTKYGDLEQVAQKAAAFDEQERQKLTELERMQQVIAAKDAEIAAARQQAETERLNALRLRVGQELGLPAVLAARLQGADEETLRADAEAVKAVVGSGALPPVPNINPTAGGGQSVPRGGGVKLTPEQRLIADQYGISHEKYAESLHQFGE